MPRCTVLYVGIEPPTRKDVHFVHCPLIATVPFAAHSVQTVIEAVPKASHIIITSKEAARHLFTLFPCAHKHFIAIGKATTAYLRERGAQNIVTAVDETQEGVIARLKTCAIDFCLWPHSARARSLIREHLQQKNIPHLTAPIYDTIFLKPKDPLPLDSVDAIAFSSPSTVEAFIALHGSFPHNTLLIAQGPVTARALVTQGATHYLLQEIFLSRYNLEKQKEHI